MKEDFYEQLDEVVDFLEVTDPRWYVDVPASWAVALTDVRGSTRAIEAGRYRDVNALGVASIIGVCNALREIDLPYVFGGDGATLLFPSSRRADVERALRGARGLAREAFDLQLRVGIVELSELYGEGLIARVARFRASPHTRLAMFAGSAFLEAEARIKDQERGARYEVSPGGDDEVSFDGFECRWQPVQSRRGRIINLLVMAQGADEPDRAKTYRGVLETIDRISDPKRRHPVHRTGLRLRGLFGDFSTEARVRARAADGPEYLGAHRRARNDAMVGRVLTGLGLSAGSFDGAAYRDELVENSDVRKFDETLRMVLDLTHEEAASLRAHLEEAHRGGRLVFGLHESSAALITCLVRSYRGDHVHFVDGADGGYALAAKALKAQLTAVG